MGQWLNEVMWMLKLFCLNLSFGVADCSRCVLLLNFFLCAAAKKETNLPAGRQGKRHFFVSLRAKK